MDCPNNSPGRILGGEMAHKITLARNTLRFAAAHFTTAGGECEPLHGHNYDVMVEIEGDLSPDSWVIDFGSAKDIVRSICKLLDHRFILQSASRHLSISRGDGHYEIQHGNQRYVMPDADVAALDIDNSTAERLAEWFAGRVASELQALGADNLTAVRVGIEEMPGQAGWFTLSLAP